jgi:hypothetical protein
MRRPSRSRVAVATGLSLGAAVAGLLFAPAASAAPTLPTVPADVPVLPALTASPAHPVEGDEVTVSGVDCTAMDGTDETYVIAALDVDLDDPNSEPADVQDAAPAADGTWSVTFTFAKGTAGDHTVDAFCLHYSGNAVEEYPTKSITVAASTPDPTPAPEPTPAPVVDPVTQPNTPGTAEKSGSSTGSATPGARITKVIGGFKPHEVVHLTLHSTPVDLGTFTADANGVVTATFTLPAGTVVGTHHLVFEGAQGTHYVAALTVAAAATTTASGSELAYTGADVAVPLVGGLVLLGAGAGAMVVGRRRKAEAPTV